MTDVNTLTPEQLNTLLRRALERRERLREDPQTTCYRLVNGEGDGLPGWTLDWFDRICSLSFYEDFSADQEQLLFDAVERVVAPRSLYVKRRPKEARVVANTQKDDVAPSRPERGEAVESLVVRENGLRYLIRPGQGLSVGLYLDMRDTRAWMRNAAKGRTVLNTFAYTCAFGVASTAGGASRSVNLDLSRRVLDWGAQNASLNDQPVNPRDFIAGDVFEWLRRLKKKDERFDVVILDPPSFSTARGKAFSAANQYSSLVAGAVSVVAPDGLLLACCNLSQLSPAAFLGHVQKGLALSNRVSRSIETLGASEQDFPVPSHKHAALKVAAVCLAG